MTLATSRQPHRASRTRRPKGSTRPLAALARALGHPARIRIVRTLVERQTCIGCDLVDQSGLAQSTVSEHLRILKAAGIISGEIDGPHVCYSLNREALRPLREFLEAAGSPARARSLRGR